MCLRFLELVQDKKFREAISVGKHAKEIDDQVIFLIWIDQNDLRNFNLIEIKFQTLFVKVLESIQTSGG